MDLGFGFGCWFLLWLFALALISAQLSQENTLSQVPGGWVWLGIGKDKDYPKPIKMLNISKNPVKC